MRLKEFIIFIIIFTIIYFLSFAIYDYFQNKKDIKKASSNKEELINSNSYKKFASFYQITSNIEEQVLKNIATTIQNNYYINLSSFSNEWNITVNELIIVILFLEYIGIIKKRGISYDSNSTFPLNDNDESLIVKYSLYFSNKMEFNEIIRNAGFNSTKELEYLYSKFLLPGIIIDNNSIYYVGDLNE